ACSASLASRSATASSREASRSPGVCASPASSPFVTRCLDHDRIRVSIPFGRKKKGQGAERLRLADVAVFAAALLFGELLAHRHDRNEMHFARALVSPRRSGRFWRGPRRLATGSAFLALALREHEAQQVER